MHRSGTSAITRVLGLCGGALPARSALDRHDSNPLGHWEPRLIVEAHERFLARSGVRWDDIFDYPSEIFGSEHADSVRERLTAIARREYGRADLFILKDPRLSRLLPLWRPVLERLDCEPRAVIAVRNPINVAASIRRRDGWDEYRALAVWTRYMLAAERDTRDMPRCFVRHEDLVDDWRSTIGKIAQRIDVPLDVESQAVAREVDAFVRDDLMHHRNADSDLFERSDIADCIKQVYRCCCAAADGEAMDTNVLDAVAEAFEHAAQVHRGRVPPALWREDRASLSEVRRHRMGRDAQLAVSLAELGRARNQAERSQQQLDTVLQTRSWRFTRPFRGLSYVARDAGRWVASRLTRRGVAA